MLVGRGLLCRGLLRRGLGAGGLVLEGRAEGREGATGEHRVDGLAHLLGGLEAQVDVALEGSLEEFTPRGQLRGVPVDGDGVLGEDGGEAGEVVGGAVGVAAADDLVKHGAEGPEVAARIDGLRVPELLGAHVPGGAEEHAGLGLAHGAAGGRVDDPGDAEVEELGDAAPARRLAEEDVIGLEIPVDDILAVRLGEAHQDLLHDAGGLRDRQARALRAGVPEGLTPEQLHDQEGLAGLGGAALVDPGDVGVVQAF